MAARGKAKAEGARAKKGRRSRGARAALKAKLCSEWLSNI